MLGSATSNLIHHLIHHLHGELSWLLLGSLCSQLGLRPQSTDWFDRNSDFHGWVPLIFPRFTRQGLFSTGSVAQEICDYPHGDHGTAPTPWQSHTLCSQRCYAMHSPLPLATSTWVISKIMIFGICYLQLCSMSAANVNLLHGNKGQE